MDYEMISAPWVVITFYCLQLKLHIWIVWSEWTCDCKFYNPFYFLNTTHLKVEKWKYTVRSVKGKSLEVSIDSDVYVCVFFFIIDRHFFSSYFRWNWHKNDPLLDETTQSQSIPEFSVQQTSQNKGSNFMLYAIFFFSFCTLFFHAFILRLHSTEDLCNLNWHKFRAWTLLSTVCLHCCL